ncbi:MAG: hypothetical protein ABII76_01610 [Pseudomonadota bacterium]
MGYNTVAVIMNDALSYIEHDKEIGAGIKRASQMFSGVSSGHLGSHEANVPARSGGGVHCNAITIVSQDHSSGWQVIVVGKNNGYRLGDPDREVSPDDALEAAARALREHGYKVTKPKAKKEAS